MCPATSNCLIQRLIVAGPLPNNSASPRVVACTVLHFSRVLYVFAASIPNSTFASELTDLSRLNATGIFPNQPGNCSALDETDFAQSVPLWVEQRFMPLALPFRPRDQQKSHRGKRSSSQTSDPS